MENILAPLKSLEVLPLASVTLWEIGTSKALNDFS